MHSSIELLWIVIVKEHVGGHDSPDSFWHFVGYGRDGAVINGEDSDGITTVDLANKLRFVEVFVEGGKLGGSI